MKKILLVLFSLAILFLAFQVGKHYYFLQGPKTFVTMHEGVASVYRLHQGDKEYLGTLEKGESMTIVGPSGGPFSALNVMKFFVPVAVTIFKTTVAKYSRNRPLGIYKYFFTEQAFDEEITRKMKNPWIPDAKVTIGPGGFKATATLMFGNTALPVRASGIVGVDKKKYGTMYVYFSSARIGKFDFPKWILDLVAKASTGLMGKGSFEIEILDMQYLSGGIYITYRKVEPDLSKEKIEADDLTSAGVIPPKSGKMLKQLSFT